MSDTTPLGRSPDKCNIVIRSEYDTFDHQLPIEEFIKNLNEGHIPDEVSVLGLEEAFETGLPSDLRQAIDDCANDLAHERPTIQFAVRGSFQRVPNGFELQYEGSLYHLGRVFGPRLNKEADDWLVMSY